MASDASLKLYLCIMLKQQPVVTWAVVAGVGGDKFFTAYLPEFGQETKMYLDQMGVPLSGSYEEATQTLTISSSSSSTPEQQQDEDSSSASFEPASAAQEEEELQQQKQQLAPELLLASTDFDLQQWLQRLPQGVSNRQHIGHAQLPLQLQVFSRVPVVVGTVINRVTCHPTDLAAKIWLDCGAGSSVEQAAAAAAAAAAAQQGEVVPSAMALETLLED
uniref:Uncharacterized protein n=1 Tax=Tetradesmus obliquus TaxID=3088 RepID=A0A383WKX8_TETOB